MLSHSCSYTGDDCSYTEFSDLVSGEEAGAHRHFWRKTRMDQGCRMWVGPSRVPQTVWTLLQIPSPQPQTREPEFFTLCPSVCALWKLPKLILILILILCSFPRTNVLHITDGLDGDALWCNQKEEASLRLEDIREKWKPLERQTLFCSKVSRWSCHSFNTYLLCIYYVSGTFLDAGDIAKNKRQNPFS